MTPELNSIFSQIIFLIVYFILVSNHTVKKIGARLLFSFRTSTFEDVDRSAWSQTCGDSVYDMYFQNLPNATIYRQFDKFEIKYMTFSRLLAMDGVGGGGE